MQVSATPSQLPSSSQSSSYSEKAKKTPTLPGNYRPISLLSIFYKLASACITNRMKPAVKYIIGKEQKAYTPEKNIGSVIIKIINLMDRTITKKEAGLILLIDFKKAFDSISHKFIYSTLDTLNFGRDLIGSPLFLFD